MFLEKKKEKGGIQNVCKSVPKKEKLTVVIDLIHILEHEYGVKSFMYIISVYKLANELQV